MADVLSTDPFTLTVKTIWETLKAHGGLSAIIRKKNFIDYSGTNRSPEKEQHAPADLPALRIVPDTCQLSPWYTTANAEVVFAHGVEILTDDRRTSVVGEGLFPLLWQLLCASRGLHAALRAASIPGYKAAQFQALNIGDLQDTNAHARGWQAIGAIVCTYRFTDSELAAS